MPIPALAAAPCALALLLGFFAAAYTFCRRLLPASRTSVRWTATGTMLLWLLSAVFHALAFGSWFRLPIALAVAACVGGVSLLVVRRSDGIRALLRDDWWSLRSFASKVTPTARAILFGLGLLGAIFAMRGVVVPPMAWDDLTYHLFKAGTWVEAGRLVREPGPDAWSYYNYFPGGGEVLWAWAMLPAHGDTFVCLAPVAIWGLCVLAAYAAARQLDFDTEWALATSAALNCSPAVARFMDSNYVDNVALAGFLAGAVMLLECRSGFRISLAFLSAAGFAFLPAVKSNGFPFFALGVLALFFAAPRPGRVAVVMQILGVSLAAVAIALPWYAYAWVDHGSPLYPFPFSFFGWRIPGNEELGYLLRGLDNSPPLPPPVVLFRLAWLPLNFKPFPYFYVALAIPGAILLWRRNERLVVLFLFAVVLLTCGVFVSDLGLALRASRWVKVLGRLLLPGMAAVILLAAQTATRRLRPIWVALVAMQMGFSLPFDLWGESDARALGEWLVYPLGLAIVAALCTLLLKRRPELLPYRPLGLAGIALLSAFFLAFATDSIREKVRYASYDEFMFDGTARLHVTDRVTCDSAFWQALDTKSGHVIAFTGGYNASRAGHTWGRYPLLGSGLQNRVVYVPITADGSIVDYWRPAAALASLDEDAWLGRLRDLAVDYLIVLQPEPAEARAIAHSPAVFELVMQNPCLTGRLYLVHREEIRR